MRTRSYQKKMGIYRRREGRMVLGVCGGLADAFELPAWIVRVLFLVLVLANNAFILLYLLLAFLMKPAPRAPFQSFDEEEVFHSYATSRAETLEKIERLFKRLNKRVQNLETIVTRPHFDHEDEFRKL